MFKKVLLFALLLLALFVSSASAEVVGTLTKLNATPKEFQAENPYTKSDKAVTAVLFAEGIKKEDISFSYYDSTMIMQMALNKGDINSMILPEFVGAYMLRNVPEYNLHGFIILKNPIALSFGFMEEKSELRDRFNKALTDMQNGALGVLARDYISGPYADNPHAVNFEHFNDAETITVAVTGDMPPLDYIDAGGTPTGFNTALLAELGRRLHVNIKLENVETGARVAALKSGRVDVVFWIAIFGGNFRFDLPDGVIVSEPYYGWDKVYLIGKK